VTVTKAGYWKHKTRWGTFTIAPVFVFGQRRFEARFDGKRIGDYRFPDMALNDLVDGHGFSLQDGLDSSQMGLPTDFAKWEFVSPTSD
jgi:hypothetical protein